MANSETLMPEEKHRSMKKSQVVPILEKVDVKTESEIIAYTEKLKKYFLYENKISDKEIGKILPLWHSSFINEDEFYNEYPLVWDTDDKRLASFSDYLWQLISEYFGEDDSESLKVILPQIIAVLENNKEQKSGVANYISQVKAMLDVIRSTAGQFEDVAEFTKKCDQLEGGLIKRNIEIIPFSDQTIFQILHLQLSLKQEGNKKFIDKLSKQISGINGILHLQDKGHQDSEGHYDFANDLLSLNEIDEIIAKPSSSSLPEHRIKRLKECVAILSDTRNSYLDNSSFVFVNKNIAEEYGLQKILKEDNLHISPSNSTLNAKSAYMKEMDRFVKTISAQKIADLEMNHSFDQGLHHAYFERFDEAYLTEEDIQYFRPFVVIEDAKTLKDDPKDFLDLISKGGFIKFLTINRVEEVSDVSDNKLDVETYLELASLAIIRRNAFVSQGGMDTPLRMSETITKGLDTSYPALWNIMTHHSKQLDHVSNYLQIKSAVDSRYFPRLIYDVQSGIGFGTHFDISDNLQPEESFPSYEQNVQSNSVLQNKELNITMADLFVANPNNLKMLELLPSWYDSDDLITLAAYLSADEKSFTHKYPFIWVVDADYKLKRAVIPATWLAKFRQRLDYWQFLEELSGVKSNRLTQAIEKERSQWESEKEAEMERLKDTLEEQFNSSREADLEKAIQNILYSLLGSDVDISSLMNESSEVQQPSISENVEIESKAGKSEKQIDEEVKVEVKEEVWIESDECTSCSDCINALPQVFKYNDDKQAFVHNPKGGAYAKIVATAEKCPARCIHPGLPHDKSEPDLDKWIKRAEKFN